MASSSLVHLQSFFEYVQERYRIYLRRKAGEPKPWTTDPILQEYRFCNVMREDDKVTVWFREKYRQWPYATPFGCVAFRFFNRIQTGELLVHHQLLSKWDPKLAKRALSSLTPLVGAAYIINTSGWPGRSKLEGIIEILNPVWEAHMAGRLNVSGYSLQQAHERLTEFSYVGSFMAYEAVTDLRHTRYLKLAPDINTWAAAGPGAARGLARICELPLNTFSYSNPKGQAAMLPLMREILEASKQPKFWPSKWPKWEMREVEHSLCEFDKHQRAKLGEGKPKQRYPGI